MSELTAAHKRNTDTVAGSMGPDLLSTLPLDILGEIISQFDSSRDTYNFSLTSRTIHQAIQPYLYASIELLTTTTCLERVRFLISRPELGRYVKELVLRPSYLKIASKKRIVGEEELARAVELLAPNLCALEKFVWDGLEVPESFLWSSLRNSCPRLKSIAVNLGCKDIDPESELFAFSDLTSFSLTTELRFEEYTRAHQSYFNRAEELPLALWNMLINRSPRLQTLVLGHRGSTLHSRRVLDVLPLAQARWSNLHSLTIENASLYPVFDFDKRANAIILFNDFISAHPTLRHLHLQGFHDSVMYLENSSLVSRGSALPPALDLYRPCYNIQELALTGEGYCGFYFQLFNRYLDTLPNLKKFSLWIDFSKNNSLDQATDYCHTTVLTTLLCRCPRLNDLTVMCSTKEKETFQLQGFAKVLENNLPHLRRLELWKCHKSGDDPLKTAAIKFAQTKPGLQKIVIRSVLGQWRRITHRMRILQTGVYCINHNEGKPVSMSVNERGGEVLSGMLTRRYQQRIEPKKEVQQRRAKSSWRWSIK